MEEAIITLFYEVKKYVTNVNMNLNTMTRTLNMVIKNKEAKDRVVGNFHPYNKRSEAYNHNQHVNPFANRRVKGKPY